MCFFTTYKSGVLSDNCLFVWSEQQVASLYIFVSHLDASSWFWIGQGQGGICQHGFLLDLQKMNLTNHHLTAFRFIIVTSIIYSYIYFFDHFFYFRFQIFVLVVLNSIQRCKSSGIFFILHRLVALHYIIVIWAIIICSGTSVNQYYLMQNGL